MLRRLLACLALLTGLTATGVPAHAQIVAELAAQVGASEAGSTAEACPIVAAPRVPDMVRLVDCDSERPTPVSSATLAAPVRIGIDRARE